MPILVLAAALAACSSKNPGEPQSAAAVPPPSEAVGERIFNGNCVACHQQNGAGITGVYPTLAKSPVVLGDPVELSRWVLQGQRPASMPAGRYPTQMLQFGWMKPADAASLFTYIRSSFGNSAPPVDAAVVAKAIGQ